MKNLKVISITENRIKHIYIKQQNKKNLIINCVAIFFLLFCSFIGGYINVNGEFKKTCSLIYSPINPLFNREENIVFTSSSLPIPNNENLEFIVPINSTKINFINNYIEFEVEENFVVLCAENGVVKACGTLPNGEKYIDLIHNKNTISRIENVSLFGVVPGQLVKKGTTIATAKMGEIVKFCLLINDEKIKNLTIKNNLIIWKN